MRTIRIQSGISAVFILIDTFSGGAPATERLKLKLAGVVRSPLLKARQGCAVYSDIPEGDYLLSVSSEFYADVQTTVRIYSESSHPSVHYVYLTPLPCYPFPPGTTLIRAGVGYSDGRPLAGARVTAKVLTESCARARLSLQEVRKGQTQFTAVPLTGKWSVGESFYIKAPGVQDDPGGAICTIAEVDPGKPLCRLAEPAQDECPLGSLLMPCVGAVSDGRGELAIPFRSYRSAEYTVSLRIEGSPEALETAVRDGKTVGLGTLYARDDADQAL